MEELLQDTIVAALAPTRNVREGLQFDAPAWWKKYVHWISLIGFFVAYVFDGMLLYELYGAGNWSRFGATLLFIIIPTICVVLFSLKMLEEDGKKNMQNMLANCFCIGPVLRHWNCIKYHKDASKADNVEGTQYARKKYYTEVRDVDFLSFIYSFVEGGAQITIQVYILLVTELIPNTNQTITVDNIWSIIKIVISVLLMAKSMASYKSSLRDCDDSGFTWYVLIFQIVYRLLLIVTRVMAISLFATLFHYYVLIIIFVHFVGMFFLPYKDLFDASRIINYLYRIALNIIFIFCYFSSISGKTLKYQAAYYFFTFGENIVMMIIWTFNNGRHVDTYEIVTLSVTFSSMFLSIVMLAIFYVFLHPSARKSIQQQQNGDAAIDGLVQNEEQC